MSASEDSIVREIVNRAWRFGVAVLLPPTPEVSYGGGLKVSGYFDQDAPMLAVGWESPRRLGILLHEYSHLTQWVEDCEVWRNDIDACWDDWLAGKRIKDIRKQIATSRELEADCERRTIRLAKELDAPIDLEEYARGANAYVHFYNVIADTRKWYRPDRKPYNVPEVMALCNPTIDTDFSETPKALREALLTCVA